MKIPFVDPERYLFSFYPNWIKTLLKGLSMKLTVLLFLFALAGCNGASDTGGNIDQLKNEVLNSACDDNLRRYLEDRINKLRRSLSEKQLIKNLKDMKEDMRCD